MNAKTHLATLLKEIEANDTNYAVRYGLVLEALATAHAAGFAAGVGLDPSEPEWPVVFIELPTGQVSWHMPGYGDWDGHSTDEKYERCHRYTAQFRPRIAQQPH